MADGMSLTSSALSSVMGYLSKAYASSGGADDQAKAAPAGEDSHTGKEMRASEHSAEAKQKTSAKESARTKAGAAKDADAAKELKLSSPALQKDVLAIRQDVQDLARIYKEQGNSLTGMMAMVAPGMKLQAEVRDAVPRIGALSDIEAIVSPLKKVPFLSGSGGDDAKSGLMSILLQGVQAQHPELVKAAMGLLGGGK